MTWVGFACAVGEGGQRLDPQVYSHDWPGGHPNVALHLHQDRDVPMSRLLADGGRENTRAGRQVAALFQPYPPQSRQLDGVREDYNRPGEAKAAQPALAGLALRIPHLAPQVPLLLEFHAAKEVRE